MTDLCAGWFERLDVTAPVSSRVRAGLWILVAIVVMFFAITLDRQAFQGTRKGDLGVYFRAAWAASHGTSLYQITDNKGLHYLYPPLLACLLLPLADPPPESAKEERRGTLPYWLSATIWFWFEILCLVCAMHLVASALEHSASAQGKLLPPRYSQGWWALRVLPFLLTCFFAGDSIGRGQITPILLLCLAGTGAGLLRGQRFRAGLWLGFAGALKLFPLYLLIYPLWRRDHRFLGGALAAIVISLLLPAAIIGSNATLSAYREFFEERLVGEATGAGGPAVTAELHSSDKPNQGFEYVIYHMLYPESRRLKSVPPTSYLVAHWVLSGLLTAAALWSMRRPGDQLAEFLFFAALALLAVPVVPESRMHYYAFGALTFAGLFAAEWPRRRGLWAGWPTLLTAAGTVAAGFLDALGQSEAVDYGLATWSALTLATVALVTARGRVAAIAAAR
jgi:glycosyl transferase family 87